MSAFAAINPVRIYIDAVMELNAAADDLDMLGQFHAWLGDQLPHHKQNIIDVSLPSPDQLVGDVRTRSLLNPNLANGCAPICLNSKWRLTNWRK
jgi:hypothetical protein